MPHVEACRNRSRRLPPLTATILITALLACLPSAATATPGAAGPLAPDPAFGEAGRALVAFPGPGSDDAGWALADGPNGTLVVAGGSETNGRYDLALARYLPGGRLDPSFGSGGRVTFDASGTGYDDYAFGVAVQPDGKIVVSGGAALPGPYYYTDQDVAVVARFLPDGRPDASFGDGGRTLTQVIQASHGLQGLGLALLPDGRIAVGGFLNYFGIPGPRQSAAVVLRYTADGRLDPSFGDEGRAIIRLADDGSETVWGLAAQPDGKLVAVGDTRRGSGAAFEDDLLVFRLDEDGALDETFDEDGVVTLDLTGPGGYDSAAAVAVDPEGGLAVAGITVPPAQSGTPSAVLVARFGEDGALANGFGDGGIARLALGEGGRFVRPRSVALLPDGRVVAGGMLPRVEGRPGDADMVVARLDAEGRLDPAFDGDGWLVLDASGLGTDDEAYDLTVLPDGRIILAGVADQARRRDDFALVRLLPGGGLDPAFGAGGPALTDFSLDGGTFDRAYAAAAQAGGGVVVAGSANAQPVVARYLPDGRVDPVFGVNQFDTWGEAHAVAIQPDGKVVAGGYAFSGDSDNLFLMRLDAGGRLDLSFGGSGMTRLDVSGEDSTDIGQAVVVQPDGKIVLAGWTDAEGGADFVAVRYTADGQLDHRFGVNGRAIVDAAGDGGYDHARAILIQPDGKLVLAGVVLGDEGVSDLALVRLHPDGWPDEAFGDEGRAVVDLSGDGGPDEANAVLLQPDGRIVVAGVVGTGIDGDIALARFDADGRIDDSFGAGGVTRLDVADAGHGDVGRGIAARAGGGLVVAGSSGLDSVLAGFDADGRLDLGFGQGGVLVTDLTAIGRPDGAFSVAPAPGGGIVAAGFAGSDIAVLRATAGGRLDPAFGTAGRVTTNAATAGANAAARAIVAEADGRLLLAGGASDPDGDFQDFAVARLGADGTPDSAFGSDGRLLTSFWPAGGQGYAAAAQADGKRVVAGQVDGRIAALRYGPDGGIDPGFGAGGRAVLGIPGTAYAAAIQPDGRILMAGGADAAGGDFAIARLNADGSPDAGFGEGGTVIVGPVEGTGADRGQAMLLQADGGILVAGESGGDMAVLRLLSDGRPDAGFGQAGWLTFDAGGAGQADRARGLALQADGRILLAGEATAGDAADFAVARVLADGRLDPSFGGDGVVMVDFAGAESSLDGAAAVAVQADGRIVVAGTAGWDFGLARLLPDGAPDLALGPSGRLRTDISGKGSVDAAHALVLRPDGGAVVAGSSGKDFAVVRYAPRAAAVYLPWVHKP